MSTTSSVITAAGFVGPLTGNVTGNITGAQAALPTVAAGATLTVTKALHAGKIVLLDTLAGSVCTLPTSVGDGSVYRFATYVLATSNSHKIQVANSTDVMSGAIISVDNADASTTTFGCAAGSDTITLNRSTTGSVKIGGDFITIVDFKAGFFVVSGVCTGTGGEATPFSAAV
jgi:hypothetical protein